VIDGGTGDDAILGNTGNEYVIAGLGSDRVATYGGNDTIYGDDGSRTNMLDGGDLLIGGDGKDTIYGGAGNDSVYGGLGEDEIHGGKGDDVLRGEGNPVPPESVESAEDVAASGGTSTLRTLGDNDTIYGDDGEDLLIGGYGDDTLKGGAGPDTATWEIGDGTDSFDGGDGIDQFSMQGYHVNPGEFYKADNQLFVVDSGAIDQVVLSTHSATDADGKQKLSLTWQSAETAMQSFLFGELEIIKVDTGMGADSIDVGNLKTTAVTSVRASTGEARGVVTQTVVAMGIDGDAAGQDLQLLGNAGETFQLRIGNYGPLSEPIEITDDPITTAANIQIALRNLLDRDEVDVVWDQDVAIKPYKITNLGDPSDALQIDDRNLTATATAVQELTLTFAVGDTFKLTDGSATTNEITVVGNAEGLLDGEQTAFAIQTELSIATGNTDVEVNFDSTNGTYKVGGISGTLVGNPTSQRLTLGGNPGNEFQLRFGTQGQASETVRLVGNTEGVVDPLVTAAAIQAVLRNLSDGVDSTVAYDEANAVYVVSGLGASAPQLELVPASDVTLSVVVGQVAAKFLQDLSIEGVEGHTFQLRFGESGEATETIVVGADGETTRTRIEEKLQLLTGFNNLQVAYDSGNDVYRVTGFAAAEEALEQIVPETNVALESTTSQRLTLGGTAGNELRVRFGPGGKTSDIILLAANTEGGVDPLATAAAIQAALQDLSDGAGSTVAYDEANAVYVVSGLGASAPQLELVPGGPASDVTLASIAQRELTISGEADQQFRLRFGSSESVVASAPITLVSDGVADSNGAFGIDTGATAENIQSALRDLTSDPSIKVVFGSESGLYEISGLTAPSDLFEIVSADVTGTAGPAKSEFQLFDVNADGSIDQVRIYGSADADDYRVSTIEAIGVDGKAGTALRYEQLNGLTDANGQALSHVVVDVFALEIADVVRLDTGTSNDHIDATAVRTALVDRLYLFGGEHDDRIIGSNLKETHDVIIGGAGSDDITGGAGVDFFFEAAEVGDTNDSLDFDTLIEERDADFWLSNTTLRIDDSRQHPGTGFGDERETFGDIFENVALSGFDSSNRFEISGWSDSGVLDGRKGGDSYILELATSGIGNQFFDIRDSGIDGLDDLTFKGSANADTIQLDTVYDPAQDLNREFTAARWTGFGDHGDGLIIGHFADPTEFAPTNLEDEEALFEIQARNLSAGLNFQVTNYASVEKVVVFGAEGDDTIISDSTSTQIDVFGNGGDDQFYIGTVLETEEVLVEGQIITIVKQITQGANFNGSSYYGGDDDDYFEVNHTVADINLFGDNGDDSFLVRALLTLDEEGDLVEVESREANVSGTFGEDSALGSDITVDTREVDIDSLVYVENANIRIDGGAGFDAVTLVGTVLSDTFYVYAEDDPELGKRVQRIFGAGVKLQQLLNIERLQLLTGGGDDTIFLYGSEMGVIGDLLIDGGSGSDTFLVGGPKQEILQSFPGNSDLFFSDVEGFEVEKDSLGKFVRTGEVDGLPFFEVRNIPRIVPFTVDNPARTTRRIMPASYDLSAFAAPVVIEGGSGLNDRIVFNTREGTESMLLSNRALLRKQPESTATNRSGELSATDPVADTWNSTVTVNVAKAPAAGDTWVIELRNSSGVQVATANTTHTNYTVGIPTDNSFVVHNTSPAAFSVTGVGPKFFNLEQIDIVSLGSDPSIDLAAILLGNNGLAGNEARELLGEVVGNYVRFQDRYFDTDLLDDLQLLTGTVSREVVVPAGVSFFNIQTTQENNVITTAKEQLEAFASEFGLELVWRQGPVDPDNPDGPQADGVPHPDPSRAELGERLYELLDVKKGTQSLAFEALHSEIIRFNLQGQAETIKDLTAVTFNTIAPLSATFKANSVNPLVIERSNDYNTLTETDVLPRLFFSEAETIRLETSQAKVAGSDLFVDNALFTGRLEIDGGEKTDRVFLQQVLAETVVHGQGGNDEITVGKAGLVSEIGSKLFLFGDSGSGDRILFDAAAEGASQVDIERNILKHTTGIEKLSRITNALSLKNISDTENTKLAVLLEQAAIPYGQAALNVDSNDLQDLRDYVATGLVDELIRIVDAASTGFDSALDETVKLLIERDQALLENHIKLFVRAKSYSDASLHGPGGLADELLRRLTSEAGVKTYVEYRDYDPVFVFRGLFDFGFEYRIDWPTSNSLSGERGVLDGINFVQNQFNSRGGVASNYRKTMQTILERNSLFNLVDSTLKTGRDRLLAGGRLDSDELMSIFLRTSNVDNANLARSLAKIYDEATEQYIGAATVYSNLLTARLIGETELNTLYEQLKDSDDIRGFDFTEEDFSKARMILSVGDFDIKFADQAQKDAIRAKWTPIVRKKVNHLESSFATGYRNQLDSLGDKLSQIRTTGEYSQTELAGLIQQTKDLLTFLDPRLNGSLDQLVQAEAGLIKSAAHSELLGGTGNGLLEILGDVRDLAGKIETSTFDTVATAATSNSFDELASTFQSSNFGAILEAYRTAGDLADAFRVFVARYLGDDFTGNRSGELSATDPVADTWNSTVTVNVAGCYGQLYLDR
jgi:Ca2+-binding RTX toxin-like protein